MTPNNLISENSIYGVKNRKSTRHGAKIIDSLKIKYVPVKRHRALKNVRPPAEVHDLFIGNENDVVLYSETQFHCKPKTTAITYNDQDFNNNDGSHGLIAYMTITDEIFHGKVGHAYQFFRIDCVVRYNNSFKYCLIV